MIAYTRFLAIAWLLGGGAAWSVGLEGCSVELEPSASGDARPGYDGEASSNSRAVEPRVIGMPSEDGWTKYSFGSGFCSSVSPIAPDGSGNIWVTFRDELALRDPTSALKLGGDVDIQSFISLSEATNIKVGKDELFITERRSLLSVDIETGEEKTLASGSEGWLGFVRLNDLLIAESNEYLLYWRSLENDEWHLLAPSGESIEVSAFAPLALVGDDWAYAGYRTSPGTSSGLRIENVDGQIVATSVPFVRFWSSSGDEAWTVQDGALVRTEDRGTTLTEVNLPNGLDCPLGAQASEDALVVFSDSTLAIQSFASGEWSLLNLPVPAASVLALFENPPIVVSPGETAMVGGGCFDIYSASL